MDDIISLVSLSSTLRHLPWLLLPCSSPSPPSLPAVRRSPRLSTNPPLPIMHTPFPSPPLLGLRRAPLVQPREPLDPVRLGRLTSKPLPAGPAGPVGSGPIREMLNLATPRLLSHPTAQVAWPCSPPADFRSRSPKATLILARIWGSRWDA
jgi:hypothetical protein